MAPNEGCELVDGTGRQPRAHPSHATRANHSSRAWRARGPTVGDLLRAAGKKPAHVEAETPRLSFAGCVIPALLATAAS